MDEQAGKHKRGKRRAHDLAYVLGEGASVGRSRVVQDALSVAPLVLFNALFAAALYFFVVVTRDANPRVTDVTIVMAALAALPVAIAFVLVSLRDHEQPITVATFVTVIAAAVMIAILSAARVSMSYWAILLSAIPTALVMIAVMLRLKRAQSERVAILDFPGAEAALKELGGDIPVIRGADADLGRFDRFLIDISTHYSDQWSRFLLRSYMRGVLVTPWVQFLEKRRGRVAIDSFDLSDIVLRPSQILYSRAKRVLDIFGVIVALPLAVVIGSLTYLYILIRAGRPVLFRQQRRGYGGRDFTMVKFRTMRHAPGEGEQWAQDKDNRIVPGLGLIRKFRFDEIPQLYNIWRGEMSWIGPRPASLDVAEATEAVEPKYQSRLLVRPGLSGWAQVNSGYAGTVREEIEKLGYDLYYVKHVSFDLDLLVMARTVRILLFRTGAK